ncbi:helix-turn-helix domain-containing protein [Metabacillus halosaccharovorans]|uniref:helix-turn-helix domain-containing protein n=1 Tax=Metabacillus halosaccharovorans TaxID=930124 RepID=UPI00203F5C74|nr:helix-turn-helix domain-containing protein [Metabacillus halosaccharovorans]MCM3440635.1 helix-turn-helix domain-containing protein [Metabacillus halosaccharovorans]
MNSKAKLILHPVRMKIVQTLIGRKELNVQQIQARLTEVPQATLYRHLNKLLEGNVIQVVKENQIRGTVEKFYALNEQEQSATGDLQKLNRDEHLHLFLTFMTHVLGQYEAYLQQDEIDLVKDGVSFRQAMIYLSDQEFQEFIAEMSEVFLRVINNEPSNERKARNISTIFIPDAKK